MKTFFILYMWANISGLHDNGGPAMLRFETERECKAALQALSKEAVGFMERRAKCIRVDVTE